MGNYSNEQKLTRKIFVVIVKHNLANLNQVIRSLYNLFSVTYGFELIESLFGFVLCLRLHL